MTRKTLTIIRVCACLLAASALQSQAAFTIGDWIATPSQTVGDTTWDLTGTTLPAGLTVDFASLGALRIQNESGLLEGPDSFTLDYTVSISGGNVFGSAAVDSTAFGPTGVKKVINGSLTLSSVDGAPSGFVPIPGSLSSLTVSETISLDAGGVITSFANAYTVVPEPATILAGVLLLLPIGASILRVSRKVE